MGGPLREREGAGEGDDGGREEVCCCLATVLSGGNDEAIDVGGVDNVDDAGVASVLSESFSVEAENVDEAVESRRSCGWYDPGKAVLTTGGTGALDGRCAARWAMGCMWGSALCSRPSAPG